MKLYKKNTEIELDNLSPLRKVTNAKLTRSIIQDDYVDLTVESVEPIQFDLEDRIEVFGADYFLNLNPKVKKNNSRNFVYNLRFEGVSYLLRKIKLFNRDSLNRETDFNFSLTTDLQGFLELILNNANHKENKWELGSVGQSETKTISFSNQNCLSALQDVATEFDIEYRFVKESGKYTLKIGDFGKQLDFDLKYGQGNGLYSLTRQSVSNTEVVTRLYGYGSELNLPFGYRDFSPRLRMPDSDYIEDSGLISQFGFVEDIEQFDIKPEFEGEVTSVGSLSGSLQKFISADMDFDLKEMDGGDTKYLINGQPAVVVFNSGRLAGYEFDVYDYNHSTKEFQILQFEDDRGNIFPDNNAFKVAVGDKFTILNIKMPQSYVDDAEQRLKTAVQNRYAQISKNNIKYVLDTDILFMRTKVVELGDVATLKDSDLNIEKEIRIVKLGHDLLSGKVDLDLSDTYEVSLVKEIVNQIHRVSKNIDRSTAENRRSYLNGFKRLKELQNSIFDPDGYFDSENIKPASIETGMLSVGAKSQRFNLEEVVFTPNYDGDKNKIRISAGSLVHFSISENIEEWQIQSKIQSGLSTGSTYYIYARCLIGGNTGEWVITTEQRKFNEESNYWNFLVAILYKPQGDVRLIDLLYGATWIQGGMITTGRIQSVDGSAYFDLDAGEIRGNITVIGGNAATTDELNNLESQIQDQEIYIEYSADGVSWHSTFQEGSDVYMRQKKGDGSWTDKIRIVGIKGEDGKDGEGIEIAGSVPSYSALPTNLDQSDAGKAYMILTDGKLYIWDGTAFPPNGQGIEFRGPKGEPGAETYMWVQYADNAQGSGMSDSSEGKLYTGLAFNKANPTPSNNPADYEWSEMPQNLEIGGRNLLLNTSDEFQTATWRSWNYVVGERVDIKGGEHYVARVYLKPSNDYSETIRLFFYNEAGVRTESSNGSIVNAGEEGYSILKVKAPSSAVKVELILRHTANHSEFVSVQYKEAKLEKGNKATDWSPAPEDVNNAIETLRTETFTEFSVLDGKIESKVSQTDFNALGQRVSTAETNITQNASAISLKADQSQVTQIVGDVTSLETRVSSAELKIEPDAIRATVKSQTEQIAQEAVDGMEIGGRNLLIGTQNLSALPSASNVTRTLMTDEEIPYIRTIAGNSNPDGYAYYWAKDFGYEDFDFVPVTYSFSVDMRGQAGTNARLTIRAHNATTPHERKQISYPLTPEWRRRSITITFTKPYTNILLYWYIDSGVTVDVRNLKLEKGNKATDWTPAPEDVEGDVSSIETRVTTAETNISQNANAISLKADQTQVTQIVGDVNSLESRVQSAELKIEPESIRLTVKAQTEQIAQEAVDTLKLGGRNLLLDSGRKEENDQYRIALYELAEKPVVGEEYTFTLWGEISPNKERFRVYNSGGNVSLAYLEKVEDGVYRATFDWKNHHPTQPANDTSIYIYTFPNNGSGLSVIERVKLEKGNKATDWSPAPDDYSTTDAIRTSFSMTENSISLLGQDILMTGKITFSSLDAGAQGRIDTADSKAEGAQSTANTALSSANAVAGDLASLESSLGEVAFEDRVELAKLGTTVVEGGYLKTELIKVNELFALEVTATKLTVTGNSKIGDFNIQNGYLTSTAKNGGVLIRSSTSGNRMYAAIGASAADITIPSTWGGAIPAAIGNTRNSFDENIALYLEAKNGTKNTAIHVAEGLARLRGLSVGVEVVTSGRTLNQDTVTAIVIGGTNGMNVLMPSSPKEGQIVIIKNIMPNNARFILHPNLTGGGQFVGMSGNSHGSFDFGAIRTRGYVFVGSHWQQVTDN